MKVEVDKEGQAMQIFNNFYLVVILIPIFVLSINFVMFLNKERSMILVMLLFS